MYVVEYFTLLAEIFVYFYFNSILKHYKEERIEASKTTQMTIEASTAPTVEASKVPASNEEQMKTLMIQEFSRMSGLNKQWSNEYARESLTHFFPSFFLYDDSVYLNFVFCLL